MTAKKKSTRLELNQQKRIQNLTDKLSKTKDDLTQMEKLRDQWKKKATVFENDAHNQINASRSAVDKLETATRGQKYAIDFGKRNAEKANENEKCIIELARFISNNMIS